MKLSDFRPFLNPLRCYHTHLCSLSIKTHSCKRIWKSCTNNYRWLTKIIHIYWQFGWIKCFKIWIGNIMVNFYAWEEQIHSRSAIFIVICWSYQFGDHLFFYFLFFLHIKAGVSLLWKLVLTFLEPKGLFYLHPFPGTHFCSFQQSKVGRSCLQGRREFYIMDKTMLH